VETTAPPAATAQPQVVWKSSAHGPGEYW